MISEVTVLLYLCFGENDFERFLDLLFELIRSKIRLEASATELINDAQVMPLQGVYAEFLHHVMRLLRCCSWSAGSILLPLLHADSYDSRNT